MAQLGNEAAWDGLEPDCDVEICFIHTFPV